MKKAFKTELVQDIILVYPISNIRLEDMYSDVETHLIKKRYQGKVIFDLIVSNGLNSNRYISVPFHENKFNFSLAKEVKLKDQLAEHCNVFYSKHKEYILNSILPRYTISKIVSFLEKYNLVTA